MFSYLDGFDRICTKVTPMEVVSLVNKMFLTFDTLSEKHDVYKVMKTSHHDNQTTKCSHQVRFRLQFLYTSPNFQGKPYMR